MTVRLDESFWGDAPHSNSDAGNINLATTVSVNPAQSAEMQALGKRFGVPTDLVRADYENFRERAAIEDRRKSGESPAVQSWVAQSPDNAALAADNDLRVMGRIERTIRSLGEGFGGQFVGSGLSGIGHSMDAIQRRIIGAAATLVLPKPMAGGEVDQASLVGEPIGEGFRALGQPAKDYWREKGVPLHQQDFGDQVAQGIGQVVGQLPMSISPAGWAMMFGQGADQLADKVAKDDAPQWKKDLAILGGGAVTAATEKFTLDRWVKLGPLASLKNPLASRAAGVGIAAGLEGGQEVVENLLHDALRQHWTNPNAPIGLADAANAGSVGAAVGGIVRTVIESALHIKGRHQQQAFQQIAEAAKETDLSKHSPDALADFAQQAAGGHAENVFIPAEAFTRYFQGIGANPAEAAALVGAKNYAEAQAAGTDVVIPMGEFTARIAPSEHMAGLMPDLRMNQGDLTARELEDMKANEEGRAEYLRQQFDQLVADGEANAGINTAIDRVVSDVEGQLLGAGVERSTARTQAQLMRGIAVLAQRAYPDMNPVEAAEKLWGQYGLTVQRDLPPILSSLKNADVQLDPLLERLRAGAIPQEQEAFGLPLHEFLRNIGGVQDQGGELSAQDVDADRAPFARNLIQKLGMEFDHARETAAQHGYPVGETEADFINALLESVRGNPVYSPNQENAQAIDLMQTLEALDKALKDSGVDLNAVDNATARKMLEKSGEVSGARYGQSVEQYHGDTIEVDGKQRPTKNSNGKPIAQTEEGLRNFWRWFGDSKVVDAEGRPLVVYHGTTADFDTFGYEARGTNTQASGAERGFFFAGSKADSSLYIEIAQERARKNYEPEPDGRMLEVYLRAENPLVLTPFEEASVDEDTVNELIDADPVALDYAIDNGYDAVIWPHGNMNNSAYTAVVFAPPQIKSATGNSGEFDTANPNILMQEEIDGDKRGFLEIGNDRKMRIGLTENANLSTFLHETGHFYLEMLGDLAADEQSAQQVKDDYASILNWLGITDRSQITVDHHEQFARANEAYLMEGKAPAPELRGVFQRFKAWLTHIYRSISSLDVKLSDEVRGVFDRIYASDQEIELAKDMVDVSPLFTDAANMGLTDAEFSAYRDYVSKISADAQEKLQAKLMREYQRGLKDWYKEERAKVRAEIAQEVDSQPVYRAFDALVKGSLDGQQFKLSKEDLVRRYGETYLKNLPRGFQRVYSAEGGIDIDTAAEMAGFYTGDDMIKALVEMRPRKELIEAETEQRMTERHGNMMLDGTMADAAKASLHNDHRADMLAIELRALNRKMREVAPFVQAERDKAKAQQADRVAATHVPPASVFRRAAAGLIDQMQVKDIQPNAYLIAGRKSAREAFAALAKNDTMTAAAAKQRELLNHYLYLEATKARQEADKFQKYAKTFESGSKRERIGKAGADYLGQIDALLARYELSKITLNAISRRQALREFIAAQEADGEIVTIPEDLQDESRQINWREAPMFELRALSDALKNLEHLAAFKNKLLRKKAAVDFADVKAQLLDAIEKNIEGSTGELGKPNSISDTLGDKVAENLRKFDAGLIKVEQMVDWLDGGNINGPWARYVFDMADDAQTREYDLHAKVTQRIQALHDSMPKAWGESLGDKTGVRLPGVDHPLTRYSLISIALNAGNLSNYDKLLKGRNWTDAQVQGALSKLTDEDWRYVQGIWDTLESLWPEIAALQKRLAGVEPEKIEAKKIVTASGAEFAGGYYPVVYDPLFSRAGEKQDDASESVQDFMARGYGRASTDKGHTKGRIEDYAAPLRLDYEQVLTSHLAKVIKDISHREAILSLNKILGDSQIKAALVDKLGMEKYQLLKTWEQTLISDRADTLHRPLGWFNAIFRGLRTNTAIVTMGWKLSTAFSQIAGFASSMDTVKPKYLATALRDFVVRPGETIDFAMEKSGEMRHRTQTIERDVKEQLLKSRGEHGIKAAVQRSAFYLTAMADRTVSVPTWLGGYRQALDAGLSEEDAVRAGDRAVRLSQGAGGAKDLSAVQRNNELMKLLTMYYTPFSVLYARLRDLGHSYKTPKDLPRLAARSLALVILPAVLGDLLAGRGPDDDEDKTLWSIRKMLMYPFASVPLIRDLANWGLEPQLTKLSGGSMHYQPGYKFTPIISAIEKIGGLAGKVIDGMTGARPWDDVAWDSLEASGYIFGLPTAQPRITGEYLYDLFTGQASPADAAEAMHDTLFRRPPERR